MVGITSMDSDIEGTCRQAVDMLMQVIRGEEPEEPHIMVRPAIVQRQSSGKARR